MREGDDEEGVIKIGNDQDRVRGGIHEGERKKEKSAIIR